MDTQRPGRQEANVAGHPKPPESAARQSARKAAKTLKLITKLLAKAGNTPFPAEAQAFQEHAERLMVRYGIEQAVVDAEAGKEGRPQESMVEHRMEFAGQYRVGQARGFSAIAVAMRTVSVLQATTSSKKLLYLIGAESDVQQILRLFASLRLQMETAMTTWWLGYAFKDYLSTHERTLERRQFQLGFLSTVAARIEQIYSAEVDSATPGSGLVLIDRRERAEQHARTLHPDVRRARGHLLATGSRSAHLAGSSAGSLATVNGQVDASSRRSLS
ncbi:DUF2786 domain-containing protein [Specibacter sp. NPDC057265]|uniref:DUF2786 domain-containing protein n=1 Tax=Specibacter sp. NPDC057265 TaxID=3346075 RepID=UPI0036304737